MAALALGEISLKDADTGNNEVVFDVDPTVYRPLDFPIRGSVFPTLDGGVVRQVMGVKQKDNVLTLEGLIATPETLALLHAKYRQPSMVYELNDWLSNRFQVIFTPGQVSFNPAPVPGACDGFTYTMSLTVCAVISLLGGSF
jgi:hypothetical protein